MQRRSNGLTAQTWAGLGRIRDESPDEPSLGLSLSALKALEVAGVAAYVELTAPGTHELFVDANHVMLARAITAKDFPGIIDYDASSAPQQAGPAGGLLDSRFDVDAAFRDIVAGFDREPDHPVAPWPANEDGDETPRERTTPSARLIRRAQPVEPEPLDPELARAGAADAEDHEAAMGTLPGDAERDTEHFVPPVPPAIPRGEAIDRFAWLGFIGGPIALLIFSFVDFGLGSILQYAAGISFIAGSLTLLVRMGDRPSRADDWDDGAVV